MLQLVVIFTIIVTTQSVEPEFWASELQKQGGPVPLSIQHRRLGRYYIRGFPKGIWGTSLFPSLPIEETANVSEYVSLVLGQVFQSELTVENAYNDFKERMKKLFCERLDGSPWSCCSATPKDGDCAQLHREAREVMHILRDPIQGMPTVFFYRWCTGAWNFYKTLEDKVERDKLKAVIDATCPNPCIGSPCKAVSFVNDTDKCESVGPFEDDYVCDCLSNAVWNQNTLSCLHKNPCMLGDPGPCVKNNTKFCIAKGEFDVECICLAGFMGPDCSLPRNACSERINKTKRNGNQNCQVQFGNECTGIIGTDYYNCTCRYGYQLSISIPEDNCLGRRDPCQPYYVIDQMNQNYVEFNQDQARVNASTDLVTRDAPRKSAKFIVHRGVVCLNGGQCIPSSDLTRAMCICPTSSDGTPLYLGPNCELPVGTWSAWSALSPCIPKDCGHTRYRWRRRRCLNTTSPENLLGVGTQNRTEAMGVQSSYSPPIRCAGTSEEVIPCDPMDPCMILRLPGYLREEILDYDTLYYFGCLTLVYFIFSICCWYIFGMPVLKAIHKRKNKPAAVRLTFSSVDTEEEQQTPEETKQKRKA